MLQAWSEDGLIELAKIAKERDAALLNRIDSDAKPLQLLRAGMHDWFTLYQVALTHPEIVEEGKLEWRQGVPPEASLDKTLVTSENVRQATKKFKSLLAETTLASFDYETTDYAMVGEFQQVTKGRNYVDMINSEITGCSFCVGSNNDALFYLSVDHTGTDNVGVQVVLEWIKAVEQANTPLTAANIMFEATVTLCQLGHRLKYTWDSTRLLHHHLDENDRHGLKDLSKKFLNYEQVEYQQLLDKYGVENMSQLTAEQAFDYGCDDSLLTAYLHNQFEIQCRLKGNWDFVRTYEFGCIPAFVDAHVTGTKFDSLRIEQLKQADARAKEESVEEIAKAMCLFQGVSPQREAAILMLLKDDQPYESARLGGDLSKLTKRKDTLKDRYLQICQYTPPTVTEIPARLTPSYKNLNQVCVALEFPEFNQKGSGNLSKRALVDYLNDPSEDPHHAAFKTLLEKAWSTKWFLTDTPAFLDLQNFCNVALGKKPKLLKEGTEIQTGSSTWLKSLLYVFLALPLRSRVQPKFGSVRMEHGLQGSPGTDEYAIELAIANDCLGEDAWKKDFLKQVLKAKKSDTRASNYWGVYPLWIQGNESIGGQKGVVHPGFSSCGTVTRRPTGSSPNMMQVEKGETRSCVVPRTRDAVILSADFSAQELKITADKSGDPTMLSAYLGDQKKDLHALCGTAVVVLFMKANDLVLEDYPEITAGLVGSFLKYDVFLQIYKDPSHPLSKIVDLSRYAGKTINFLSIYGGGPEKLSRAVGCTLELATLIFDAQAKVFSGLGKWKAREINTAKKRGYVKTSYGNYRHLTGLNSSDRGVSSRWERQGINSIVQGTAADILKVALTRMVEINLFKPDGPYLLATVYDEVLTEVDKALIYPFTQSLRECMNILAPGHKIRMEADFSIGPNWAEQIEIGSNPTAQDIQQALAQFPK
jgi:DNA polymerase I-like protein with 3'-5' exonuclease and polymerase domains